MSACRVRLRAGDVFTLEETLGWKSVEVVSGEMWLTKTPASEDLLLGAGEEFELGESFPVVIEALGETEIVLRAPDRETESARA
jgi:Protein of unknown function (DUF2917).